MPVRKRLPSNAKTKHHHLTPRGTRRGNKSTGGKTPELRNNTRMRRQRTHKKQKKKKKRKKKTKKKQTKKKKKKQEKTHN